ncbi:hypothetical protein LTR84_010116 [Exophiala bonariae]|uniref:ABC transporter domain-containing protein n=1 Tax=Exophiala bonariae TaxID=1690606 RepID=A0AAV9NKL5_9EURO|nr:hypothetical protein LTR84_010116 [Exophiala bonariae]
MTMVLIVLAQVKALVEKNLLILAYRRGIITLIRALALPIVCIVIVSYISLLSLPPSKYGLGTSQPIRDITSDLFDHTGARKRVVFINNDTQSEATSTIVERLSTKFSAAKAQVYHLPREADLPQVCQGSLAGTSKCYAAVIIQSSPSGGSDAIWSYRVISDWNLGTTAYVDRLNNDPQIFSLPLIHAIDSTIADVTGMPFPQTMLELPFTDETNDSYQNRAHKRYMSNLETTLAVTCFIAVCGITFHLTGYVATERELGMSQLIDVMMLKEGKLHADVVRVLSTCFSFIVIYLPGFIAAGGLMAGLIFKNTAPWLLVIYHILFCIALVGFAHLCGSLFRHARLSGISIVIFSCVLAVLTQFVIPSSTIVVGVLVVLVPPINFVSFLRFVATWEQTLVGAQLSGYPDSRFIPVPGWLYLIGCLVQIIIFPSLTIIIERSLYGTRALNKIDAEGDFGALAVRIQDVSKSYTSSRFGRLFGRRAQEVHVLKGLNMSARGGEITSLLGINGSGKSTTLRAVCGLESTSSGTIEFRTGQSTGYCPQRNILWNDLTVEQHLKIFSMLKSPNQKLNAQDLRKLISNCDLERKTDARACTLSGGQKRKLQLAMAFVGGSHFCCIDEASSGLDPVSRRHIWKILLAERGSRSILFTTHDLDEADALSDQVYILVNGKVTLSGSVAQLKEQYGGGYEVKIPLADAQSVKQWPKPFEVGHDDQDSSRHFFLNQPNQVADFLDYLEEREILGYDIYGPTIEKAFMDHAGGDSEVLSSRNSITNLGLPGTIKSATESGIELRTLTRGNTDNEPLLDYQHQRAGHTTQVFLVVRKRIMVLRHTFLPLLFAILIPIIAIAACSVTFMRFFFMPTCSNDSPSNPGYIDLTALAIGTGLNVPIGPSEKVNKDSISSMLGPMAAYGAGMIHSVDSFQEFESYIHNQSNSTIPGGLYLGNNASATPVMAYRLNGGIQYSAMAKGLFDAYLMNATLEVQLSIFDTAVRTDNAQSIQFIAYFGLSMVVFPALLALYPSFECQNEIQALQVSNGIRTSTVWLGHFIFDGTISIVVATVCTILFYELSSAWHAPGYLAATFLFYGLSSTLYSYVWAKIVKSPLSVFAIAAGSQGLILLLYILLYFVIGFFETDLQHGLNILQFVVGLVMPSANLVRALLLTLNASYILCRGPVVVTSPGDIAAFGSPILYLVVQCVAYFIVLVHHDSGAFSKLASLVAKSSCFPRSDAESRYQRTRSTDVLSETKRTESSMSDSLRVIHVNKRFARHTPVLSDLTFGIQESECFALLGPNGAGKTTTIDLIRGHGRLDPSDNAPEKLSQSDIMVCGKSMVSNRRAAIQLLSVCPQYDAIDYLTVRQHLIFYGRTAGIPTNSLDNVIKSLLSSLDLSQYVNRMASKLSGGNKRKLSIAIALIARPRLLILDEPSCGMDALSKRKMWKLLSQIRRSQFGRNMSILMTSHSMEEVSALADRVGIMRKTMLAVGERNELCSRYQDRYHVHLVLRNTADGPQSPSKAGEDDHATRWVKSMIPHARIEKISLNCQMSFSVPRIHRYLSLEGHPREEGDGQHVSLAAIIRLLEANKDIVGIEYYTVSQSTLEDVFISVVGMDED